MAGDPAPWFHAKSTSNPNYAFDTVAGRFIVLCFFGSAGSTLGARALDAVKSNCSLFDDDKIAFFGISNDMLDKNEGRVREALPGIRYFWDFDGSISREFGALPVNPTDNAKAHVRTLWMVLDPTLRVMKVFPFMGDGADIPVVFEFLQSLPQPGHFAGFELQVPILVLPNVFEPELCSKLIDLYEADGGEESGFVREIDGKTVTVIEASHKRRKDFTIEDAALKDLIQLRIKKRVVPEIEKVHQFKVTRMERYLVGCYTAEDGGHFRAHRDNTTKGTAHRRFAVSINLNADFTGGELNFPEYGQRSFKAPPGGAVVFSCSMLHAVSKVTSGRRYAFLPFLYDDEAASIREANNAFLDASIGSYSKSRAAE